ncbi:MAG: hypothetical protein ACHREM_07075 [Polyangiales bacterium]
MNSSTTTVQFSKADGTAFGNWDTVWSVTAGGTTVASPGFPTCSTHWVGATTGVVSFPTSALGMTSGGAASLQGTIWPGTTATDSSCSGSASPTGILSVSCY